MTPSELPQHNFIIGQMADDLVSYTIDICVKRHDDGSRFPYKLYNTYVDKILGTALTIQEDIFTANSMEKTSPHRRSLQLDAIGKCVYICHLIRISFDHGWISPKQRDRWVDLAAKLMYKLKNWIM